MNTTQKSNIKTLEKGKVPPQALKLEKSVLGAMIQFQNSIEEVVEFLKPEVFYKQEHSKIYKAIHDLYLNDYKIDILTVSDKLKKDKELENVGGDYYLIDLQNSVSSSAHIEYHSRVLHQMYIKRELIKNANAIIEHSYDEGSDSLELLDKAYTHLNYVGEALVSNKEADIQELTHEIVDEGGKIYRKEIKPGIPTPILKLTNKMGGWRRAELIILAARPGMGKTAFALKTGWVAALNNIPVGFFSLEMSAKKLMQRIWSMECRIEGDRFTKDGLSPDEQARITNRANQLGKVPFYIDDTPGLNIQTLRVKAKKLKKSHNVELIIVDYLQLMDGKNKNREQEISQISRGLKMISVELDIPVIALSQLSRSVENRGGSKRPLLSDLRESGAIEQDADVVGFIYRPEYYNQDNWDDYGGVSCRGEAEYIISKNRNGGLVRNRMRFEPHYTLFSDIEEEPGNFIPEKLPKPELDEAFEPSETHVNKENDDDLPF